MRDLINSPGRETPVTIIATGIDLAKNVFAVHGVGVGGAAQLRQAKPACGKLNAPNASMPPGLIGMQACSGAHQWARQGFVTERTACINRIRGLLGESRALASGTNTLTAGALPDMLTFTPDGSKLLVANEASPLSYGIRVIDTDGHRNPTGGFNDPTGSILDVQAAALGIYNDGRSDDKGVEPEGVELLSVDGRTLAFIGLERSTQSAIGVFDITDPGNVSFLQMLVSPGDVSPEGLKAFRNAGGEWFLALSNEVTNTTSVFALSLAPVPEPGTWALMLGGVALLGWQARRRPAR